MTKHPSTDTKTKRLKTARHRWPDTPVQVAGCRWNGWPNTPEYANELNDPFEFIAASSKDSVKQHALELTKKQMNDQFGIISFSRKWQNPVLWSHYAASHQGIALGFDITVDDMLSEIKYYSKRFQLPELDEFDEEFAKKLLNAKFKHWEYEVELRLTPALPKPENGKYFNEFDQNMVLKEIVLGVRYQPKSGDETSRKLVAEQDVKIVTTRLAFNSFKIVKQKNERLWKEL